MFEEEDGEVKRGHRGSCGLRQGRTLDAVSYETECPHQHKYIHSFLTPSVTVLGGDGSGKRAVFTNG